jgi:hypothetical protein
MEGAATAESVAEPECGFKKCVKDHPLHCCHTAYGVSYRSPNPGIVLRGWRCDCGKESRTVVAVKRT